MKLMKRKSWESADAKIARLTGGVPSELPVAKDRVKGGEQTPGGRLWSAAGMFLFFCPVTTIPFMVATIMLDSIRDESDQGTAGLAALALFAIGLVMGLIAGHLL